MERKILFSSLLLLLFACSLYSQEIDIQATIVGDYVHVYERPLRSAKIIGTLPNGGLVDVLSEITVNDFYLVSFFGKSRQGWIRKMSLKLDRPERATDDVGTSDANWNEVGNAIYHGFRIRFLIDSKRIGSHDGRVNFWLKKVPLDDKAGFIRDYYDNVLVRRMPLGADPEDFAFILEYWEADCTAQRSGVVQIIESWQNFGLVPSQIDYAPQLNPVIPDSVGEAVLRRVCGSE